MASKRAPILSSSADNPDETKVRRTDSVHGLSAPLPGPRFPSAGVSFSLDRIPGRCCGFSRVFIYLPGVSHRWDQDARAQTDRTRSAVKRTVNEIQRPEPQEYA